MRKFAILITLLVVAIITSCEKPTEDKPVEQSDFELNAFYNTSYISVNKRPGESFSTTGSSILTVKHISGPIETISLASADVPTGMHIFFTDSTETIITSTSMNSWASFNYEIDSSIRVGNYYPKVIATSASGIIRTDSILVQISQ